MPILRWTWLLASGFLLAQWCAHSPTGQRSPGSPGNPSKDIPHRLTAAFEASAAASPLASTTLPDLVEKVLPGVVNISSTTVIHYQVFGMEQFLQYWGMPQERRQTQTSLGSGFIIDQKGFILTNNHVVEKADEVVVTLLDKRRFRARIIGKDQKMDIALLRIRDSRGPHEDPGKESSPVSRAFVPVRLGDSDTTRIAESVFAVGNPFGLQHTVTLGIISAKNRTIGSGPFDNFLQTDASINPGNSGGPLFNLKGEVVGINTMIFSESGTSGGLGFAIPINEAKKILADLKQYGRVPRPWLGVQAERMTIQLQQYYDLRTSKGVLIYTLVEGGPADQAGIQQGDILLSINGSPTLEPYEVERILARHKPSESVRVRILRGSKVRELEIRLQELPRLKEVPQGII